MQFVISLYFNSVAESVLKKILRLHFEVFSLSVILCPEEKEKKKSLNLHSVAGGTTIKTRTQEKKGLNFNSPLACYGYFALSQKVKGSLRYLRTVIYAVSVFKT